MVILDAEYQFDRHKLTFFFEADRRIDFRELVSELFSQYKTRIWMQQVDTSTLASNDAGTELAKATGFLPKRDDQAYLQMAHSLMRGGGGGGVGGHSGAVGGSSQMPTVSAPNQGRSMHPSSAVGYGADNRSFVNTYGDSFATSSSGGVSGELGGQSSGPVGLQQGGRGQGAAAGDRRGLGNADPWLFSGHH